MSDHKLTVICHPSAVSIPVWDANKLVIEIYANHCPHARILVENKPLSDDVENVKFCTMIRLKDGRILRYIGFDLVYVPPEGN